ncbi:hypothetical protein BGZ94_007628 [Podila epigama]|nr:hypothetical protein BGZ94_007628 [Podila epigama]
MFAKRDGDDTMTGKEVFCRRQWVLPTNQPQSGRIAPGVYTATFEAVLEPTFPSSSEFKGGRVTYKVEAKLHRKWSLNVVESKRIWYSATKLPPATIDPVLTVGISSGVWRNALPYSIIFPSDTLFLGQLVPVTIHVGPLLANGATARHELRLLRPRLRLKQYAHLQTSSGNSSTTKKTYVVDLDLSHWPRDAIQGFEDRVLVQLPVLPLMAPTTQTAVYSVRHSLNFMAGVAAKDLSGVMKVKVKVDVTGPRPPGESVLTQV